mmetsp:Transcript_90408/g.255200  ORF Transcript_90408/g.255200 Transcript_90408/m.255200 type:complete len:207 (-) Transcript_90408:250-870(-)
MPRCGQGAPRPSALRLWPCAPNPSRPSPSLPTRWSSCTKLVRAVPRQRPRRPRSWWGFRWRLLRSPHSAATPRSWSRCVPSGAEPRWAIRSGPVRRLRAAKFLEFDARPRGSAGARRNASRDATSPPRQRCSRCSRPRRHPATCFATLFLAPLETAPQQPSWWDQSRHGEDLPLRSRSQTTGTRRPMFERPLPWAQLELRVVACRP